MYLPLILITLLSATVCYFIARKRSADPVYWVVLGLLLGPLAIPFVCFAKPRIPWPGESLLYGLLCCRAKVWR